MANWSGFWGDGVATTGSYEFLSGKSPNRSHLTRILRKRGMQQYSEVLTTLLTDATPASTASVPRYQIKAEQNLSANVQGGVRSVELVNDMEASLTSDKDNTSANTARAVSASDVTNLKRILFGGAEVIRAPSTYPTDASGNGGGGKLG